MDEPMTSRRTREPAKHSKIKPAPGPIDTTESASLDPETSIWLNANLRQRETTAQLDDQKPVTLYYLGRAIKLDEIVEIYVDQKSDGEIKHWTVIESRDFDIMDQIYDIELDTRDRFPYADLVVG